MSNVLKALARGGAAETDPNFKQTVLLLHGDGTNGAQNNTFLDSSTNNFTITRNGNTTQGTFSPFSLAAGEWSNYFDGTGDYLTVANNAAFDFGSGDFTIEVFVYTTSTANQSCYTRLTTTGIGTSVSLVSSKWYGSVSINGTSAIAISSTDNAVPNSWNHVALTRSGTTLTLWVNGVSAGTNTVSGALHNPATTSYIGAAFPNTIVQPAIGYISNLRIVKGTAVYTSAFTPPTAPLTAITNTSLLTCQSNRFVDNSTNNFTLNRFGDVRVTPFSPFAPTAAYSAGTNGGSGYFDGTGDYLSVASATALNLATGAFTIEAWVYLVGGTFAYVASRRTAAQARGFVFYYDYSTKKFVLLAGDTNTASWEVNITSTNSYDIGQWVHVAITRNSSNDFTLWVNGTSQATANSSVTIADDAGTLLIGAVDSGTNSHSGYFSSWRLVKDAVYTTAFTPPTAPLTAITNTSLLLNFTNAGIIDNTGKNNLETVGNAQIDTTTKKYGTGSMEFDGTGDYLSIADDPNQTLFGDFTIEGWLYLNTTSGTQTVVARWQASGTQEEYLLWVSSGTLQFYFKPFSNATPLLASSVTLSATTWNHFAIVRNGSSFVMYIDGVSRATTTNSSVFTDTTAITTIGSIRPTYTIYDLNGYIDDLRITKGVARYTANFTAPTKEFPDL